MSGKGNSRNSGTNSSSQGGGGHGDKQPEIVQGWEYHTYARRSDRYVYIGKDDSTGEPEFIDYGPKSSRR
eukprot:CAMPEP_0176498074 /NCGR_PEP_ID=MMETSP0200_2-20121128/12105_1 /TAXON_ID=947934 /ORGANISM="Chaetoceros sp., Strain GSL56" /LENGTH=69 /DNA_ID=CAMNT_0017896213 /DNA_START=80 /DNA_END=289 /DNA_ORIENTATION=+